MKTRQGFVSNSSSSSFIVAKAYMTEKQIEGLREGLRLVTTGNNDDEDYDNKNEEWGENGRTWRETSHYFYVETYYVYRQIDELLERLDLQDVPSYHMEG